MDCKQILQDEIFENYFLNRLKESARVEFENHIKSCSSCQKEFQKQQMIFMGIRQVAQREIKEQIKIQAGNIRKEEHTIKWQILLKTAAVLLFLSITPIAVYYYQQKIPVPDSKTGYIHEINDFQREKSQGERSQQEETKRVDRITDKVTQTAPRISGQQKTSELLPPSPKGTGSQQQEIDNFAADKITILEESDREEISSSQEIESPAGFGTLGIPSNDQIKTDQPKIYRWVLLPLSEGNNQYGLDQESGQKEEQTSSDSKNTKQKKSLRSSQILIKEAQPAELKTRAISETTLSDEMGKDTLILNKTYYFLSDSDLIQIEVLLSDTKTNGMEEEFPSLFESKIVTKEFKKLKLEWSVNRKIYFLEPNTIRLEKQGDSALRVIFDENTIYQINLEKEATQAVLLK
jgi:hypothetical protein